MEEVDIQGQGVKLRAWWFRAEGERRGTVIYLHGVADNRGSSISIADRFVPQGFDVLAYDSRAHGESTGDACTYGFYEKRDLMHVLNKVDARPIIVIGTSLGAAVAIQAAADDDRIDLVVAVATFSDLRTVANERAPFFASKANIDEALRIAEQRGSFKVNEVSPVLAAGKVGVPVLVIHGEKDHETPPVHSRRVHAALRSPKRLIVVPNAGHNDCLTSEVWIEIEKWLAAALQGKRAG
ncbi:MAG: alpha/beta hydrolase [Deltaproteobacteria bacterium]|nr:alpha/beta hydrolase [Deltaproteobacteria bacterium]